MRHVSDRYTLANGVEIPCIGFGTWDLPDGDGTVQAVLAALKAGYRHIDCAALYGNQKSVGEAIKLSGIARGELYVNSKVWNTDRGYDKTLQAFERSLGELGLEYLDMYLIHWPATPRQTPNWQEVNLSTWRAMEKLYTEGRVRAIGVSNFLPHHLAPLMDKAEVMPVVNQVEYHPGEMKADVTAFCMEHNILVEAWSPLGEGAILHNATLLEIAYAYGKSAAQVVIKWCLQNGILPLPRSKSAGHIAENAAVFDFELSMPDIQRINELAYLENLGSGLNPDELDEDFM